MSIESRLDACGYTPVDNAGKKALGARLKRAREARGLKQERAAQILECSLRTISRAETGTYTPRGALLTRMAELYGVSVDMLLGGDEPRAAAPAVENASTLRVIEEWLGGPDGDELAEADREWARGLAFRDLSGLGLEVTPSLIARLWRERRQQAAAPPVAPNIRPGRRKLER